MCCGAKCAKYTLEVFNFIFWLAGGVILGVSIWVMVDDDASQLLQIATLDNSQELIKAAAITLCVVGSVIFVIGFLGCFGAMKESVCMLNTYAVIVIILLVAQITAGILAVIYKDDLLDGLSHAMNTTVVEQYGGDQFKVETEAWDFMQTTFKCCGVKQPTLEWSASQWKKTSRDVVPDTCCVLKDYKAEVPEPVDRGQCNTAATNSDTSGTYYHYQGCYTFMYDWAIDHSAILIGVAFGLAGLQIVMVVLACCFTCEVRNKNVYA